MIQLQCKVKGVYHNNTLLLRDKLFKSYPPIVLCGLAILRMSMPITLHPLHLGSCVP